MERLVSTHRIPFIGLIENTLINFRCRFSVNAKLIMAFITRFFHLIAMTVHAAGWVALDLFFVWVFAHLRKTKSFEMEKERREEGSLSHAETCNIVLRVRRYLYTRVYF